MPRLTWWDGEQAFAGFQIALSERERLFLTGFLAQSVNQMLAGMIIQMRIVGDLTGERYIIDAAWRVPGAGHRTDIVIGPVFITVLLLLFIHVPRHFQIAEMLVNPSNSNVLLLIAQRRVVLRATDSGSVLL